MWLLDKKHFEREAHEQAASPVLVAAALLLFLILLFAVIGFHYEKLISVLGAQGIDPGFVGP